MPRKPNLSGTRIKIGFVKAGFEFHTEVMKALENVTPDKKLDALIALAPYFMEKMGTPRKNESKAQKQVSPILDVASGPVSDDTAAELAKLLSGIDLEEDSED